jgi:hypothetical protein
MKKNIWFKILPVFVFLLLTTSSVRAASLGLGDAFSSSTLGAAAHNSYNTKTDIYDITGVVIQTILSLLGVIFIVLIIYAGVTWMTAEGDEAKVEKAQKILRNAIIGLIIIITAYAISYFVISVFRNQINPDS